MPYCSATCRFIASAALWAACRQNTGRVQTGGSAQRVMTARHHKGVLDWSSTLEDNANPYQRALQVVQAAANRMCIAGDPKRPASVLLPHKPLSQGRCSGMSQTMPAEALDRFAWYKPLVAPAHPAKASITGLSAPCGHCNLVGPWMAVSVWRLDCGWLFLFGWLSCLTGSAVLRPSPGGSLCTAALCRGCGGSSGGQGSSAWRGNRQQHYSHSSTNRLEQCSIVDKLSQR